MFLHQVTLKNHASGEEKILFLNSEQEKDKTLYTDQVLLMLSSEFAHQLTTSLHTFIYVYFSGNWG